MLLNISSLSTAVAGIIGALGIGFLFAIAYRHHKKSWTLSSFFQGGRNIGAPLTEDVFWGTSFSLANGLFYFAVLGYLYGLAAIWFQIPWVLAMAFLAWKLPQLLKETERFTLHGFLGNLFGKEARLIASIVTLTGFLGVFAFELNVSMEIMSGVLGFPGLVVPLSVFFALLVASYCDIGGFLGTAQADRYQNRFGLGAVLILLVLIFIVRSAGVPDSNLEFGPMLKSAFDFTNIPVLTMIGIVCYASFYNIVDMSNWQAISANSATAVGAVPKLRRRMIISSLKMFVLPGIIGTLLGSLWRGQEVQGYETISLYLTNAFGALGGSAFVGAVVGGLVVFGLAATSLSIANSYLISAVQTSSWDIFNHSVIDAALVSPVEEEQERQIISKARRNLYVFAICAILAFLGLRYLLHDQETVWVTQFLLASIVISLGPATITGLHFRHVDYTPTDSVRWWCRVSIVLGYLAGVGVFVRHLVASPGEFNAFAWGPIASLSVSALACGIALGLRQRDLTKHIDLLKSAEQAASLGKLSSAVDLIVAAQKLRSDKHLNASLKAILDQNTTKV